MRAVEAMIVWTPAASGNELTAGRITVVPWPDVGDRGGSFLRSVGACSGDFHRLTPDQRLAKLMLWFHQIVLRDQVPLEAAHQAFLGIDEYAEGIALSIEGAREPEPHFVGITQDLPDDLVVDLKATPSVEECIFQILDMARPELGDSEKVLAFLRGVLKAELDSEPPVHLNVQAAYWALTIEGTMASPDVLEARWNSIREALRNA